MRKNYFLFVVVFIFVFLPGSSTFGQEKVEKWGIFELSLKGSAAGNPFVGVRLSAVFRHQDKTYAPEGFYDGDGIFKIRFMPNAEGLWTYETSSNRDELNGKKGEFLCTAPAKNNHGPVRVRNRYHFAYEDGTPFFPVGTTIYEWPFQAKEIRDQTIETLKNSMMYPEI